MPIGLTTDVKVKPGGAQTQGGGGPGDGGNPGKRGPEDWPPGFSREDAMEPSKFRVGMWAAMVGILMLFIGLTSAYILRQSFGLTSEKNNWRPIPLPQVLWLSSALILASSVTMELARRALRRNRYERFRWLITATAALGFAFLGGQFLAWRRLVSQGVYMHGNPHSSFFYLLTGLHAVHLAGGLVGVLYVTVAAHRLRIGAGKRNATEVAAIYWHFMDGLWVYLLLLLFFWG